MSEYPYEDKIHSDDKVNYKTVYSSDRIKMVISLEGAIKDIVSPSSVVPAYVIYISIKLLI